MKLGIAASTLIACISASAHAETWVPVPDSDYFYEKDSVRRTRNIVSVWQRNNPATSEAYKSNFEIDCDNRKIQMVETHYASGAYAKGTGMPLRITEFPVSQIPRLSL